jgi:hypothetical protein
LISALILLSLLWLVLAEWPAEARGEPAAMVHAPTKNVFTRETFPGRRPTEIDWGESL